MAIQEIIFGDFAKLAIRRGLNAEALAERFANKIERPSEFFHRVCQGSTCVRSHTIAQRHRVLRVRAAILSGNHGHAFVAQLERSWWVASRRRLNDLFGHLKHEGQKCQLF